MFNKNLVTRVKRKAERIYLNPDRLRQEVSFLTRPFFGGPGPATALTRIGWNWKNSTQLPIAILWGFGAWKRRTVSAYLPEYRTAFVDGDPSIETILTELTELEDDAPVIIIGWGKNLPSQAKRFAARRGARTFSMEDGFLRSTNPGMLHTKALSLVLDETGIYYDATQPSDLEKILATQKLDDPELMSRAKSGLAIMRAARLTKYFPLSESNRGQDLESEDNQAILVLGQMEKDASIRFGSATKTRRWKNAKLIQKAQAAFPGDDVFFRPHPDLKQHSGSRNFQATIGPDVTLLDSGTPLLTHISQADRIVTQTSLSGFEALVHGKTVNVEGLPFYAGWGLTQDTHTVSRRNRSLSLEQLFAGAYLQYPRYLHPNSDELVDFFAIASHFIVERIKYENIFELPSSIFDQEVLRKHSERLTPPARLLLLLLDAPHAGEADVDKTWEIIAPNVQLRDAPNVLHLLAHTSNYEIMAKYCTLLIEEFDQTWDEIKHNQTLVEEFLKSYAIAQKNASGRVLPTPKNINCDLIESYEFNPKSTTALIEYTRILSNNLEYDIIEDLLAKLDGIEDFPDTIYRRFCAILVSRPTRSERDHPFRWQLTRECADKYELRLNQRFTSEYDILLNEALKSIILNDEANVVRAYNLLIEVTGAGKNFGFDHPKFARWGSLQRRLPHFYSIYNYLLKAGDFASAETMLNNHFFRPSGTHAINELAIMENLRLDFHGSNADHIGYLKTYAAVSAKTRNTRKVQIAYARALRGLGRFHQSIEVLRKLSFNVTSPSQRVSLETEIDKLRFVTESGKILNAHPQPRFPKGVVFLASQTCYNTLAMMTPALLELKRSGYAVVNIMEGMVPYDPTGINAIDKYAGIIPTNLFRHELTQNWEIDWNNRKVYVDGINFWQGFYERLSTQHRKYHIDLNEPAIFRDFLVQQRRCDMALFYCKQIYRDVVKNNINATFVSGNSHVTPFSIFRDFARHKDDPRLGFINCNVAYEAYFSNVGSKFATTMSVTDMTLHRDRRAPFLALRGKFEDWYSRNEDNTEFSERADQMIKVNRNNSSDNTATNKLVEELNAARDAGKTIICCFGKVPVDLNVPYDGGPGHLDMADWITHTVESVRGRDDIILLVKPHPHELKPEIALDLIDSFSDLIATDIPDNVRVLGHREINVHALAPHLDLAILWNGSSSLELTALGVPVMMCSFFGRHDYPVDLIYPETRKQYRDFIGSKKHPAPDSQLRKKAAFLISYQGTDEVSIKNNYSVRQLTNDKVGIPRWREANVKELLRNGDPSMQLVAKRIVEKFEPNEDILDAE